MIKSELKDYLKNTIFSDKGKLKYSTINKLDEYIKNIIYEATSFLNDADISERIYYILNDVTATITCPCCKNNKPNFISISSGYFGTCSVKCSAKFSSKKVYDTKIQNNSFINASIANKKTKLLKYGDENFNNREKAKQTCVDLYGVDNPMKVKEIQDKTKSTNAERYGVENPFQAEIVKDKIKETNLRKYGVENPFQAEIVKDKIKETNLRKYGVENYTQTGLNETSGFKWKEYVTPNSNILKVQGHEPKLLDEIFLEYHEDEILTSRKDMPEIWYLGLDGKQHRYFPDMFIPKTNTIYEVKSDYTLNVDLETNNLKFQAVKDAGFNFVLKVY